MTQTDELPFKMTSEVVYKPQSFLKKKKKDILRNSLEIEKEIKQSDHDLEIILPPCSLTSTFKVF